MPRPILSTLKPTERHDLLVVGSGVAGLSAAIEAAGAGLSVLLLTKDAAGESNTDKAQGGVAVALSDEDEVGLHHRDTIAAGDGLCDEEAVQTLVEEGPGRITDLIGWGARFDRDGAGLAFAREGAHSAPRVIHAAGDSTGQEIVRALLDKAVKTHGISFLTRTFTVDLIVEKGRCEGLLCLEEPTGTARVERGAVLLAAGGCGQVYRETTNPPQATGDGIAMAFRAGARVRDMEFVQFHPTSLAIPGAPRFLLSEALRGEGGVLRGRGGRRFMQEIDAVRAELAPRDVVARAISREMNENGMAAVFLDLTHLNAGHIARRFPRIHRTCLGYGIDITRDPIPVSPSAHYMMGGVATDLRGRTTIPGLYAAGEVACAGVHGANRLASNSLLEGLVFGARAGRAAIDDARSPGPLFDPGLHVRDPENVGASSYRDFGGFSGAPAARADAAAVAAFVKRVRDISWGQAGIIRDGAGLRDAAVELRALGREAGQAPMSRPALEARNLLLAASLITVAALVRRESRGAHYRADYPARDDPRYRRSFLLALDGSVREIPLPGEAV